MKNIPSVNLLLVSVRIYRALLVAYPKMFREHYETQMVQVFRDSFREAYHRKGMSGVIDLWLHTFADLLITALHERVIERSQFMFSPKVILWGGLASIFSGLFWMLTGVPTDSPAPLVLALVLGLGGLASLYSLQAGQGGKLALAGFILGIIGTVMTIATLWWVSTPGRYASFIMLIDPTRLAPPALIAFLGLISLGIGLGLLGVTSLRGNALHRWRSLPLGLCLLNTLVGMTFLLVYYLPLSQGLNPWKQWYLIAGHVIYPAVLVPQGLSALLSVLLGIGWMGLGSLLATQANAQVAQTPESSAEAR